MTSKNDAYEKFEKSFEKLQLTPKFKIGDSLQYKRSTNSPIIFIVEKIEITGYEVSYNNGRIQDHCKKINYEVIDEPLQEE